MRGVGHTQGTVYTSDFQFHTKKLFSVKSAAADTDFLQTETRVTLGERHFGYRDMYKYNTVMLMARWMTSPSSELFPV